MIQASAALVVPVDAPAIPLDLAEHLMHQAGRSLEVPIVCEDNVGKQPLFGIYRKSHRDSMERALARGDYSVQTWCMAEAARWVRIDNPGAFTNVNTPSDLRGA
jgi:molybdopterin molybdotransferase/molybdopterin-guanine dinucleotide biosynthesis protein A